MKNLMDQYIEFSIKKIRKYIKMIFRTQYDDEIVRGYLKTYLNSRYYNVNAQGNTKVFYRKIIAALDKKEQILLEKYKDRDKEFINHVKRVFFYILFFDNVRKVENFKNIKSIKQVINELVNSIKDANYKNELFRNKYRNIDVLLVDDIQFIANKKTGQEEFFHTFNTLHQTGKQIIISSDRPPRDIPLLEERLKSRFEWGILADISMPDYETRLAILRKKVQTDNIIIDDYILSIIATKIDSNIRELEGALNKIVAYANLTNSPITIEIAEKSINDIALQKEKVISADYIQEVVAKYFNIDKKDLISSKRSNDITYPRQIAMYLCRTVGQMSFPKIGADFGKRDHTTVMHAVEKIEKEIKQNTNTKLIVDSVKNIIQDSN